MFGLGWPEILALVVIALLVFGPEKLPQAAQQAGRMLRQVRQMANNARNDLQDNLGPEFANFDPTDLHPKNFVRKHLLSDIEEEWQRPVNPTVVTASPAGSSPDGASSSVAEPFAATATAELAYGEIPPYDSEAT
ncbi:sec-independent protein translocase protein TatB [Sphaerisporangium siamense]|uniref:Sec-independent protein translocase protein TatB n=1 Tax=Sphaerisporangium siamense TaxID=795645 RepID=A0A7W7GBH4_9ACTN|nr:sec-independent translocase [Sphaerisporangium siamense]MBB4700991.1 sec-independent protein translocase protein TatB [Sphaerisporangium siamense]GII85863.1 sec-independent protein translocase protein TatB [Sphaerisporangium siamense]